MTNELVEFFIKNTLNKKLNKKPCWTYPHPEFKTVFYFSLSM